MYLFVIPINFIKSSLNFIELLDILFIVILNYLSVATLNMLLLCGNVYMRERIYLMTYFNIRKNDSF